MPEMIGVMGSSGFVGWMVGPALADWVFRDAGEGQPFTQQQMDHLFLLAAAAALISLNFAALATRYQFRPPVRSRPPMVWLLRRYHPGPVLLVGVAMGLGIGLPHVFLRAYTAELNIGQIKTFFIIYAITAFTVRILTRRFSERFGIRTMNLLGLVCLSGSMLLYLLVSDEWMLAAPALAGGVAHAFLFPATVGGGSGVFPRRYRGLGITLMLAMLDTGGLLGQPAVGGIIELARLNHMPPYPTMFISVAAFLAVVAACYALTTRGKGFEEDDEEAEAPNP